MILTFIIIDLVISLYRKLEDFLKRCGVPFTLLAVKTPSGRALPPGQPRWRYARGVDQRNRGLQWLRENFKLGQHEGVVYIADDDNTYSIRLFDEVILVVCSLLVSLKIISTLELMLSF